MPHNEYRRYFVAELIITILALCAFAANSILARLALTTTEIDPVSFTGVRLVSGTLMLWLVVKWRQPSTTGHCNWTSALISLGKNARNLKR
ncbi:MAG: hypothetical protein JJU31_16195 [Wenzhouxiangella sp.]|nr:hypothetical protein [Wenzhouxiangella sp.]MCH8478395.1 hypothetical protein [Wenzhouxiangella sp.]